MVSQVAPAALVAGTQEDSERLEVLYRRFGPIIHRRCLRLLGSQADAHDALQDVFVRLCEALSTFRGDAEILTWIYRIATNQCLNRLRHQAIERRDLEVLKLSESSDPRHRIETVAVLRALLARLSDEDVQLLIHVHHDGLDQKAISKVLKVSTRTVRTRLARAEIQAREVLTAIEKEALRGE